MYDLLGVFFGAVIEKITCERPWMYPRTFHALTISADRMFIHRTDITNAMAVKSPDSTPAPTTHR